MRPETILALVPAMLLIVAGVWMLSHEKEQQPAPAAVAEQGPFDSFDRAFSQAEDICDEETELLIIKEDYTGLMEKSIDCMERFKKLERTLETSELTAENAPGYYDRKRVLELTTTELNYLYSYSKILADDGLDSYSRMLQYFVITDELISRYYMHKDGDEPLFNEHMDKGYLASMLENFRQFNHELGAAYDTRYNDGLAKYFLQVNPNNEAVVYRTERLIAENKDIEAIKQGIYEYVRDSTLYKHDPNWKDDWVQPPSLTMLAGTGDCDDQSVLLASLFMRAGVSNVELCLTQDHMFVRADGKDWDPTCTQCNQSKLEGASCHEINQYIRELGKCADGTKYRTCSEKNIGFYCDGQGQLRPECAVCGCPGSWHCDTDGQCFACEEGQKGFSGKRCCPQGSKVNILGICI